MNTCRWYFCSQAFLHYMTHVCNCSTRSHFAHEFWNYETFYTQTIHIKQETEKERKEKSLYWSHSGGTENKMSLHTCSGKPKIWTWMRYWLMIWLPETENELWPSVMVEAFELPWRVCDRRCRLRLQLAFCAGEHQMAAASVPAAEGSAAGCPRCGPGPATGPGALFRWLGPHTSDCGFVQAAVGPLLPHCRGKEGRHCFWTDSTTLCCISNCIFYSF